MKNLIREKNASIAENRHQFLQFRNLKTRNLRRTNYVRKHRKHCNTVTSNSYTRPEPDISPRSDSTLTPAENDHDFRLPLRNQEIRLEFQQEMTSRCEMSNLKVRYLMFTKIVWKSEDFGVHAWWVSIGGLDSCGKCHQGGEFRGGTCRGKRS